MKKVSEENLLNAFDWVRVHGNDLWEQFSDLEWELACEILELFMDIGYYHNLDFSSARDLAIELVCKKRNIELVK